MVNDNDIEINKVVTYRGRTYRVIDVIGARAIIYPTPDVITPRDRDRGPLTVAIKTLKGE